MKQIVFALFLLPAFFSGVYAATLPAVTTTKIQNVITTEDTGSIQGEWKLMPMLESDTATGKIPFLIFDLKANKFSGNTGCNSLHGSLEIRKDGGLAFGKNIASTKMACQGYNEQTFLDNLLQVNRYEIENGVLKLMYNTTVLSQWVRHINTNPTKTI